MSKPAGVLVSSPPRSAISDSNLDKSESNRLICRSTISYVAVASASFSSWVLCAVAHAFSTALNLAFNSESDKFFASLL